MRWRPAWRRPAAVGLLNNLLYADELLVRYPLCAVTEQQLLKFYAHTTDPWNARASADEQQKYQTCVNVLAIKSYHHVFELGCGNGEFARHLVTLAQSYTGMDAVPAALAEAKKAVPNGQFWGDYFPCPLPQANFDLLVFAEILSFLDEPSIAALADQVRIKWPLADILTVNVRGPSGNCMQGEYAADCFRQALAGAFACEFALNLPGFRLEKLVPARAQQNAPEARSWSCA